MFARCVCHATLVVVFILAASLVTHADIYRWDNGQLIPGTEGIEPGPGVDLSSRGHWEGVGPWNTAEQNLRYADFSGELDLTNASFKSSWLESADFSGANLAGADFSSSTLHNANFTGADLTNAVMGDVTGVDFTRAVVSGANLSNTGITEQQLSSTLSYQQKNLQRIILVFNDLTGWNLSGQDLRNSTFSAGVIGARVNNTNLTGADLRNAQLGDTVDGHKVLVDSTTVYNQWTSLPGGIDPIAAGLTFWQSPRGDCDANDSLDTNDIDWLSAGIRNDPSVPIVSWLPFAMFDLNSDGTVNLEDHRVWVKDIAHTWYGDANLDGEFNTGDLVRVLGAGKYEKGWLDQWGYRQGEVASWSEGDWNGDGVFGTGDLVIALEDGGYEMGPREPAAVPEPSGAVILTFGLIALMCSRRCRLNL